jgi:hypothetical protein
VFLIVQPEGYTTPIAVNPSLVRKVIPSLDGSTCQIYLVGDPDYTYMKLKGSLEEVLVKLEGAVND